MKKASIVVSKPYQQDKLFDLDDLIINRDNCMYPFFLLRQKMAELGYILATQDIHSIEDSEIVIYNEMPQVLPRKEDIAKSYLLLLESELIKPENWNLNKHQYFKKIFTWHDDFIDNKKYFKMNFSQEIPTTINFDLSKKEKLCTLIAGNKKVNHALELYSKRIEAIEWFEKHHPTDFEFYGIGWNDYTHANRYVRFLMKKIGISKVLAPKYQTYQGSIKSKKEILEKYKFAICYENARDIPGYITEKIFDCLFAGCVPIYWGANNITDYIPKECFIDKREFESYETLYDFIRTMKTEQYMSYLHSIEAFLTSQKKYLFTSDYFINIIIKTILDEKICS